MQIFGKKKASAALERTAPLLLLHVVDELFGLIILQNPPKVNFWVRFPGFHLPHQEVIIVVPYPVLIGIFAEFTTIIDISRSYYSL
jgi:hypothetical protein